MIASSEMNRLGWRRFVIGAKLHDDRRIATEQCWHGLQIRASYASSAQPNPRHHLRMGFKMDEKDLINKIKNAPEAFSELFKLYYQPIFGYIIRRTANFDDAADIAADTFLKAFRHIHNFRYSGISVKVWLYRIATNEINLYFRFKQKHNSIFERIITVDKDIFNDFLADDRKEIESELQKHDQFLSVLKELKTLPVKYQEVIALRYFEGKDNKEISEILGMNEGTLKSLLSRGLEKLRKKCNQF